MSGKYLVLVAAETVLLKECCPFPAIVEIIPDDTVTLRTT